MSTPMTRPFLPTLLAARKQSNPAPEPRSSTVSPALREARATGFPHPSPRLAPSGTLSTSSSEYPTLLLASRADWVLLQHEALLLWLQQEPLSLAILPHISLTPLLISGFSICFSFIS